MDWLQKITVIILTLLMVASPVLAADQPDFDLTAKSAILMEAETGEILFEKDSHKELPPASMTKIMTMLLVMEALTGDRASLQDKILVSERAAGMGGSQVYLEPGEEMTLENLMKTIAISSANDACVAVAEYISGTEADFVERMNERARELNLNDTYYYNTNGLPPGDPDVRGNYTSARDLAVLARELLKYPRVLEWTSTWIDYIRDGEFVLNNTNRLVRHYSGADGIKTGHTQAAKFCVTSTASRNNLRFIAVIMGADTSQERFEEAARLLSYGFNTFESLVVAGGDEIIEEIIIPNAVEEKAGIIPAEEVRVPVRRGEEDTIAKEIAVNDNIRAPLAKGDKAGVIKVYKGNLLIKEVALVVNRDVEKASLPQMIVKMINRLFSGLVGLFARNL